MATISFNLTRVLILPTVFAFSLALFILATALVSHATLNVYSSCHVEKMDSSSCTFVCDFRIVCPNKVNARILALHFNWDAIYDNTTTFSCSQDNQVLIQLPKRNYRYILRGDFYNGEYGISQNELQC
jgi:hypothetical protein